MSVVLNELRIGAGGGSRRLCPNSGSHFIDVFQMGSKQLRLQAFDSTAGPQGRDSMPTQRS